MPKNNNVVLSANETAQPSGKGHRIFPKVMAFIIAFVLWFYVVTVESPINEKVYKGVPVKLVYNDSLYPFTGDGATVNITVSGKKSDLNQIDISDITVTADASYYTEASRYNVPITVDLPKGATFVDSSIDYISVYLDKKIQRGFEIKPITKGGDFDTEHYEQGELETNISKVTVEGPAEKLDEIESAVVVVELEGNVESTKEYNRNIKLVDSKGEEVDYKYISMSASQVTVKVPVYQKKQLDLQVAFKHGYLVNGENCKVTITPSFINVRGDAGSLASLGDSYIVKTLDEKLLSPGKMTVSLALPSGVSSSDGIDKVDIVIEHVGMKTRKMTVSNITVNNAQDIEYELVNDSVEVTLMGPADIVPKLKEENIKLVCDLEGYDEISDEVILPLDVIISDTYSDTVYEIGEYSIKIKLK